MSNRKHERLAIALLAEARRLYRIVNDGNPGGVIGYESLADDLTKWASDVREIGVVHSEALEDMRKLREVNLNLNAELRKANRLLAHIRQLCRDNKGLHFAKEILEITGSDD